MAVDTSSNGIALPFAAKIVLPPQMAGWDAYWGIKQRALEPRKLGDEPTYEDIELPRNSATGFTCAAGVSTADRRSRRNKVAEVPGADAGRFLRRFTERRVRPRVRGKPLRCCARPDQ